MLYNDFFQIFLKKTSLFRVHYKNWNKRYDEWVKLDRIMRIYDDDGKLLKKRSGLSDSNPSSDEDQPIKKSIRSFSKGSQDTSKSVKQEAEEETDEKNEEKRDKSPGAAVSFHFVS